MRSLLSAPNLLKINRIVQGSTEDAGELGFGLIGLKIQTFMLVKNPSI